MTTVHVRLRIDLGPACSIGPGKVALLEAVDRGGSLSGAARDLGMSYRRAWLLLEEANASFDEPLTRSSVGGAGGGGVELTEFGRALVTTYREFERSVDALGAKHFRSLAARAAAPKRGAPTRRRPLNRR
ncbi:MAG: LysR family transcriptional regulator [Steroidobacteraceae bacterium]|jgi:molybdate transport system regulatory protein|nr:LysR family transcriptional regulator [Steroidobacteraceae bacterium]